MLKKISLGNFKCFENIDIPLQKVNVLTGINGMGKSTVIQSLLLLRQSYMKDGLKGGLCLNGRYVNLGNGQDILYENPGCDQVKISLCEDDNDYTFLFDYSPEEDVQPVCEEKISGKLDKLSILQNQFVYLSADRIKPQELYGIINEQDLLNREFAGTGEYAIQFLEQYGANVVTNPNAVISNGYENTLANQVRAWMDMISPGVVPRIRIDRQLRKSELRYEYIEGRNKTSSYKSVNVGFGITYVLPIIIALLTAEKDDLIILENPEAHIHPHGQRKLGELIAAAGAGGAQIIIETHSDHILNGIRIAVKKKRILPEDTKLLYFYKDAENYKHRVKIPEIKRDGRLTEWPEGFLDEWDRALLELL